MQKKNQARCILQLHTAYSLPTITRGYLPPNAQFPRKVTDLGQQRYEITYLYHQLQSIRNSLEANQCSNTLHIRYSLYDDEYYRYSPLQESISYVGTITVHKEVTQQKAQSDITTSEVGKVRSVKSMLSMGENQPQEALAQTMSNRT